MNGTIDRKLMIEVIILLGILIGGWMMAVEPKISELNKLEAKIQEAKSNPVLQNHDVIASMAGRLDEVRSHVGQIERQSAFAQNSSIMSRLIKELAAEHDVKVRRLDPGSAGHDGDAESPVSVARFVMLVEASYGDITRFLSAVTAIEGYIRPVSLTLVPRGNRGEGYVEAQFTCEAVSFALPEALTMMMVEEERDALD